MNKENILAKTIEYAELSGKEDNSIVVEYNLKDKTIKKIEISTSILEININFNSDNSINFHEKNKLNNEIDDWNTNQENIFLDTIETKSKTYLSKIRSSH